MVPEVTEAVFMECFIKKIFCKNPQYWKTKENTCKKVLFLKIGLLSRFFLKDLRNLLEQFFIEHFRTLLVLLLGPTKKNVPRKIDFVFLSTTTKTEKNHYRKMTKMNSFVKSNAFDSIR